MGAPVLTNWQTVTEHPWFIRKAVAVSGNTATAFDHGGPVKAPDAVVCLQTSADPTASDWSCTSKTTTQITLDFEDDGNDTFDVFIIWFSAGVGGTS
jgi:hypothetical protein